MDELNPFYLFHLFVSLIIQIMNMKVAVLDTMERV